MSKLKTLNEIPHQGITRGLTTNYSCCARTRNNEIREEAIKWIKELEKTCINLGHPKGNEFLLTNNSEKEAIAQIRILKHFFDITWEDIK